MSFGPYADHADCVAKHGDKVNPHAFCAWLEHQITKKWPSENDSGLPDDAWLVYRAAYSAHLDSSPVAAIIGEREAHEVGLKALTSGDWMLGRTGWIRQYAAPKMRTLLNVRIFAVGTWMDSAGEEREWTEEDVLKLVAAFNAGVPANVPAKLGHTPDSFNLKVAEKMGVPVEALTGLEGHGAPALGRMATLELRGPLLVASFERVPEPIADMIESGLLDGVSVEIEGPVGEFKDAITAVAFLGAEEPAVDLATLDRALVFGGKRENARVFYTKGSATDDLDKEFALLTEGAESTIKGMRGAPIFRELLAQLRAKFKELKDRRGIHSVPPGKAEGGNPMESIKGMSFKDIAAKFQISEEELMVITAALGLEPTAGAEEVVAAIEALKAKAGAAAPGEAPPGDALSQAAFTKATTELAGAKDRIVVLEQSNRKHDYLERVRLFSAIPERKPEEIAEELVGIHTAHGEEAATKMLSTYQALNKMGQAALEAVGSARSGEKANDYDTVVQEYMKANPTVTRAAADKVCMRTHSSEYTAMRNETRRASAEEHGG